MTDEQRKRIHAITYSTQDREELAERIVKLEDERDLYSSLVEDMDHPDTANQLRAENAKLRELLSQALAAHELDTFFEYFEPHSFWVGWCEDVHGMGIEVGE